MTTPLHTVLCYGDSNTHGSLPMGTLDDLRRLGPTERWPGVMAAILGVEAVGRGDTTGVPVDVTRRRGRLVLPP